MVLRVVVTTLAIVSCQREIFGIIDDSTVTELRTRVNTSVAYMLFYDCQMIWFNLFNFLLLRCPWLWCRGTWLINRLEAITTSASLLTLYGDAIWYFSVSASWQQVTFSVAWGGREVGYWPETPENRYPSRWPTDDAAYYIVCFFFSSSQTRFEDNIFLSSQNDFFMWNNFVGKGTTIEKFCVKCVLSKKKRKNLMKITMWISQPLFLPGRKREGERKNSILMTDD